MHRYCSAPSKRPHITAADNTGLKYFEKLKPLLERLHEIGCERDKAGNRELHYDELCLLLLLGLLNPVLDELDDRTVFPILQADPGLSTSLFLQPERHRAADWGLEEGGRRARILFGKKIGPNDVAFPVATVSSWIYISHLLHLLSKNILATKYSCHSAASSTIPLPSRRDRKRKRCAGDTQLCNQPRC